MRRFLLLMLFGMIAVLPAALPATAAPSSDETGSVPVRIVIEDIGMDRPLMSVGLDRKRVPIVPKRDVGWYNLSARPGQGENIVMWGHVLRFRETPKIAAPFARVKELKPGALIVLYTEDGAEHRYVVTRQMRVKPNEVKYILPVGSERLTLVSCIGDKVIRGGDVKDMTQRLITIAEPAKE